MIARARRAQKPRSRSRAAGSSSILRMPRTPSTERSAGCSVAAAAIERSGTRKPPTPSERTNGTGTKSRRPSPIPTVAPEKRTERPAVSIVRTIAPSTSRDAPSSSRKR